MFLHEQDLYGRERGSLDFRLRYCIQVFCIRCRADLRSGSPPPSTPKGAAEPLRTRAEDAPLLAIGFSVELLLLCNTADRRGRLVALGFSSRSWSNWDCFFNQLLYLYSYLC